MSHSPESPIWAHLALILECVFCCECVGAYSEGFGSILEVIQAAGKCILLLFFLHFYYNSLHVHFFFTSLCISSLFFYNIHDLIKDSKKRAKEGAQCPHWRSPSSSNFIKVYKCSIYCKWGCNKPSSTAVSHEAPLSGDFILLLREELEHIWEFV